MTPTWPRWCRSIPPVSGPTSTRPARAPRTAQGALSNYTNLADEPADHALGRSRGGWTTKIHALIDATARPLPVTLTAGQAGDNPQLQPLLIATFPTAPAISGCWPTRPTPTTRPATTCGNAASRTPSRALRPDRTPQGQRATRRCPPGFDPTAYRHRNTIERGFNRLKHWRGIATRYDKYALTFLGGVTLAAVITYHRVRN